MHNTLQRHKSPERKHKSTPSRDLQSETTPPPRDLYSEDRQPPRFLSSQQNDLPRVSSPSPSRSMYSSPGDRTSVSTLPLDVMHFELPEQPMPQQAEMPPIIGILQAQVTAAKNIDQAKMSLALRHDFSVYDLFKIFDSQGKGYLLTKDFVIALAKFGVTAQRDEPTLLVRSASEGTQKLTLQTFSALFFPFDPEYRNMLEKRQPIGRPSFSPETTQAVSEFLFLLLECEGQLEAARQELRNSSTFSILEQFEKFDRGGRGEVTFEDFKTYLTNQDIDLDIQDLYQIFQVFDENRDGKVNYSDFVREISPKSPERY